MGLRVMHVGCGFYPYKGGSSVRLGRLIASQTRTESHVITHVLEDDGKLHGAASIHRLNYFSPEGIREMRRLVHRLAPDAVVLHNPRVITLWSILIDPRGSIARIGEIHSFRHHHGLKRTLTALIYHQVDLVVVLSRLAKATAVSDYRLAEGVVEVIQNGMPEERQPLPDGPSFRPDHRLLFAYIGSMHEWQGVLTIAAAAAAARPSFWEQVQLVFAGGGTAEAEVRAITQHLAENGDVRVLGWLPTAEAERLLVESDVVLMPRPSSTATETIVPLKVLEAMNAGKAIIASSVGGFSSVLEHGATGHLVSPGDPVALLAAMEELAANHAYRSSIAAAARRHARTFPSWLEVSRRYEEAFARVSGRKID